MITFVCPADGCEGEAWRVKARADMRIAAIECVECGVEQPVGAAAIDGGETA